MATRIAILGWGSLLWEESPEFDQWHEQWQVDGPTLQVEFSRVSSSRSGALTLVIDEEHGAPIQVAWCLSKRTSVEDTVCDLRCREGTTLANIGGVDATEEATNEPVASIVTWARSKQLDSVVWTALKSNFHKDRRPPFSVDAAISYLQGLDPSAKVKAAEYVWRAPAFVRTPLRSALEREPWFGRNAS